MQTIPGLVPTLQVGSFEGGQFSANGQATNNNLFLVDGQYDNDSRRGGSQGTQARVSLDSMSEYQVQTHQYGAEYGGSTGVVVNSVTKSGTNKLSGRAFEYFQDNKLQATDYFLKQRGRGESRFGQQRVRRQRSAARSSGTSCSSSSTGSRPAPTRRRTSTSRPMRRRWRRRTRRRPASRGPNTFLRFDYHLNGSNQLSFRWTREAHPDQERLDRGRQGHSRRGEARERRGRPRATACRGRRC